MNAIRIAPRLSALLVLLALFPGCGPKGVATKAVDDGKAKLTFIELGSVSCVPCRMMQPIMKEIEAEYGAQVRVVFHDVQTPEGKPMAAQYGVKVIPTQVFLDAAGRELFRHEGFFPKSELLASLAKHGLKLNPEPVAGLLDRWLPLKKDTRSPLEKCQFCDHDLEAKTHVVVDTAKGEVHLGDMHCLFIMLSCLLEDKAAFEKRVSVTDWSTGKLISARKARYLYGLDEKARPIIKAFATEEAALAERREHGGNLLGYEALKRKELAARCGFCDRSVYPEDASRVRVDGLYSWGCCPHCAMGVAARTGKDIEVVQPDALTGESITVTTRSGAIASVNPKSAVAWYGQRKNKEGKAVSAGCFHQGFFTSMENLKKWLEKNPFETGQAVTLEKILADKMALSTAQIQKACKVGECAPK